MLDEELADTDEKQPPKKLLNTTPMTFTISIEVRAKLMYYSKALDWNQSHIVSVLVYYHLLMDDTDKETLDREIDELMA